MPKKRKLSNLGDRCRFCLARDACTSELFAERLRPKLENLEKCCDVEIKDVPNFPKSVCYVCLYKLEMWSEFKAQFLQTNKTLLMHFKAVEPQVPDEDKIQNAENTADDSFPDNDQKRLKIDDLKLEVIQTTPVKQVKPLELAKEVPVEPPVQTTSNQTIAKSADEVNSDMTQHKDEVKATSSLTKSQQSDTGSYSTVKKSRSKKLEREASTKRWVERKNALIAATGEVPSESDSENGSPLSPVQKARARCNSEKIELERKKKLLKALKNLETNMTEKYKVNQQDLIVEERKTRSRRGNVEEHCNNETIKSISLKSPPKKQLQKTPEHLEVDIKENNKNIQEPEKQPDIVKETEKPIKVVAQLKKESVGIKEPEKIVTSVEEPVKQPTDAKELVEQTSEALESEKQPKSVQTVDEPIEVVRVENESMDVDSQPENKLDAQHEKTDTILPQLVKSEVCIGNATYIVTTMLDLPNSSEKKNDPSVKTNGINSDATTQDGEKIDLMNAVQLQRVKPSEIDKSKKNNVLTASDIQKCLKIEVEGMEVEALQRVQLEIANFINQDIHNLLSSDSVGSKKNIEERFKDSYDSLGNQLKAIIEKVLRSNIEEEKLTNTMFSNHKRFSPEFIKAAANSHLFQPKVVLNRMNLGKLCKTYQINNLRVLEDVKRSRGLVGPLSRTLGKRKHILPKKYDGFSLSLKPTEDELRNTRLPAPTTKSSASKPDNSSKVTNIPPVDLTNDLVSQTEPIIVPELTPPVKSLPSIKVVKPDTVIASPLPIVNKSMATTTTKTVSNRPTNTTANCTTPSNKGEPITVTNTTPSTTPLNKKVAIPTINKTPSNVLIKNKMPIPAMHAKTPNKPLPIAPKPAVVNNTPKRQRHICGICGKELFSKEEAETHVKNHKVDTAPLDVSRSSNAPSSTPTTPILQPQQQLLQQPPKPKPKLMRCKRCQAIVEARHVKTHVCDSVKYNCTLCECSFGAEHLLIAHIETHTQQRRRNSTGAKDGPLKDKTKDKSQGDTSVSQKAVEDLEEMLSNKDQQGYSCFVCDKVFVEEEQMKDHLQMHCEEVSDEGDEKGFQCAFCGEKFQTEESLETHVGNHLLEDGDEKINMMINLDTRRDKPKKPLFKCEQCSESFSSSLLLAMHLPLHEDEESSTPVTNDYDKQQADQDHNVCTVCDEIFDTAEELSEHLDMHNGNSHVCILCEKPFSSIRDLQEHVSTHL